MNIKEQIGKRIAKARKQAGLTTKQLAERTVSLKPARIGNWEQGTRTPGVQEVKQLAAVLGVSSAYLLCLTDDNETAEQAVTLPVMIPLLNCIQVLNPSDAFNQSEALENVESIPVGKNIADNMGPHTFAWAIDDDSMQPDFKAGEIIIVDPDTKPKPGQYVIAKIKNEDHVVFRKYRERSASTKRPVCYDLVPLNPDWANITIDAESKGHIIGTMLEHRRLG